MIEDPTKTPQPFSRVRCMAYLHEWPVESVAIESSTRMAPHEATCIILTLVNGRRVFIKGSRLTLEYTEPK